MTEMTTTDLAYHVLPLRGRTYSSPPFLGEGALHSLSQTICELYCKYGGDDDAEFAIYNVATELELSIEYVRDIIENERRYRN